MAKKPTSDLNTSFKPDIGPTVKTSKFQDKGMPVVIPVSIVRPQQTHPTSGGTGGSKKK
jgi:hypothetical protein